MEETQAVQFSSEDVGEDFYETIEAPKFVDLRASDPFRPDDRFWFCSRVGCEENHPEEMDSEVIYKNFVMRVMAARSPNVRLHRARRNMKCPLTAPPKSSKSRVSRLALISSISKKIADARVKSRPPPSKPTSTPRVKTKQVHSKALTTPRNRDPKPNSNAFRSVRNPKAALAEVPKTRMVAKALVFQSPKKEAKNKALMEVNTPVRTLCSAMKKLEISSAKKKNLLGGGNPMPLDVSRKKFRGREVKSRVFDSLGTHSSKYATSTRVLKGTKEKSLKTLHDHHVLHECVNEDASDMDIDEKSRHVSMEGCSLLLSSAKSIEENQDDEVVKIVEPTLIESSDILSKSSEGDETSISNSENRKSEGSHFRSVLCEVVDEKIQEFNHEEKKKSREIETNISEHMESDDKENVATVNKENAVASDYTENVSEAAVYNENENVAPNDNSHREENSSNESERVTFCKVKGVLKKNLKENSAPTAVGSHGLKSSKPKPTNPKPFRLRTDERGILREANLEKKLNCALKDITSRRIFGDKLQRKNQNMNQKHGKCLNNCELENRAKEDNEQKTIESKIPDDAQDGTVPVASNCIALKNQKQNLIACHESGKEKDKLKRTKLEKMQQNVRKILQRNASYKKEIVSQVPSRQTSLKTSSHMNDAKLSKSSSRGRVPAVISKEPNLHSSHLPRSSSRKLT